MAMGGKCHFADRESTLGSLYMGEYSQAIPFPGDRGRERCGKGKGARPREQGRYTPQVPVPPLHPSHSGASPHPQWWWHAALPLAGSSAGQVLQQCGHREPGLPCEEPEGDAGMKWGGGACRQPHLPASAVCVSLLVQLSRLQLGSGRDMGTMSLQHVDLFGAPALS